MQEEDWQHVPVTELSVRGLEKFETRKYPKWMRRLQDSSWHLQLHESPSRLHHHNVLTLHTLHSIISTISMTRMVTDTFVIVRMMSMGVLLRRDGERTMIGSNEQGILPVLFCTLPHWPKVLTGNTAVWDCHGWLVHLCTFMSTAYGRKLGVSDDVPADTLTKHDSM